MNALQLEHRGALHGLQPAAKEGAAEGIARSGYVEQPRFCQGFALETPLDVEDRPGVRRFHDDMGPAARAGQVARLIEAADDVARPERKDGDVVADDVE